MVLLLRCVVKGADKRSAIITEKLWTREKSRIMDKFSLIDQIWKIQSRENAMETLGLLRITWISDKLWKRQVSFASRVLYRRTNNDYRYSKPDRRA